MLARLLQLRTRQLVRRIALHSQHRDFEIIDWPKSLMPYCKVCGLDVLPSSKVDGNKKEKPTPILEMNCTLVIIDWEHTLSWQSIETAEAQIRHPHGFFRVSILIASSSTRRNFVAGVMACSLLGVFHQLRGSRDWRWV